MNCQSFFVRTKGIRAWGYGIVPKYAMQDTDLELSDKALYAYIGNMSLSGCLVPEVFGLLPGTLPLRPR